MKRATLPWQQFLTDYTPQRIFVKDLEFRYQACNQAFARDLFLTPAEIIGKTDFELYPLELAQAFQRSDRHTLQQGCMVESKYTAFDHGQLRSKRALKTPIRDEHGQIIAIHCCYWDATRETKLRSQIEESEERFRTTFDQAAVGMAHVAPNGRWLRVNQKFCDIVGYSHDEMLQLTFQDITDPADLDSDLQFVEQVLAGTLPTYSMEKRYIRKTGEILWVKLTVSLVRNQENEPLYFISVVEDIHAHKLAEQALQDQQSQLENLVAERSAAWQEAEQRLRLFWENSADALLMISPRGDIYASNPEACRIFQMTGAELHATNFDRLTASPLSLERMDDAVQHHSGHFTEDQFLHRADGQSFPARISIAEFADSQGQMNWGLVIHDNTERWKTEEALRQLSLAVEQSPVSVVITDTHGAITYANPKFSALTGYSVQEALGENPRILKSGITSPQIYEEMWACLASGREWSGELCNKKKNGDLYWEYAYLSPVSDARGVITHYVGVKEDITERRRLAQALEEIAITDELTGLMNRRGFILLAEKQLKIALRQNQPVTLAYVDLDGMKGINDEFGHLAGDQALRDIAQILQETFRAADIIARIGGDEFAVLSVNGAADFGDILQERLEQNVQRFNQSYPRSYRLSASLGAFFAPAGQEVSLDELLFQGDKLMYTHKVSKKVQR